VQAQTYTNYPSKADDRAGGCTLDGAAKAWACCTNNAFVAEGVGPTAETYSIPWSAFTGGIPEPTLDPSELLGIQFQFNCREVPETPCDVAVTIDRVHFYRGKPRLGPRDDVSTATPARMNGCE